MNDRLPAGQVDQKRVDALEMVAAILAHLAAGVTPLKISYRFQDTGYHQAPPRESAVTTGTINGRAVSDAQFLSGVGRPAGEPSEAAATAQNSSSCSAVAPCSSSFREYQTN